jgi:hypothetical protein
MSPSSLARRAFFVAIAIAAAAACGSSGNGGSGGTFVSVSNYDQSCQHASDCVAAVVGDVCGPGCVACPSAAINMSAAAKYQADYQKAVAACATPPMQGCPGHCLAETTCNAGMCIVCPQGCADAGGGAGDGGVEATSD